jgi:hypothetical protein
VEGADRIVVRLQDGRELEGKVVGTDPKTDVAVVRVEGGDLPSVKLGGSDALRVGEWVLAIGSPFGPQLEHTVTAGIISAKGRSNVGLADYEDFLQTDAAINPGNSGGPLVNLRGEVVGINTAIASRTGGYQGVSFAIPIDVAIHVKNQLVAGGKVERGRIGVTIQDVNQALADSFRLPRPRGALVSQVERGGPADKAGLKAGDVILAVDDREIERSGELPAVIAGIAKGAGMIEPNMATMLVYLMTDAELPAASLRPMLKRAVDRTFNCMSIDTDTSTSDTVVLMANGLAGRVNLREFESGLLQICEYLTREIARNGEGATKLMVVDVGGAKSQAQAKRVAKLIANSPLVKTAVYGSDPNWGRDSYSTSNMRRTRSP